MENYSYPASYPDSGDSSPRSREIEFENPTPWEEQLSSGDYKVKFMCSYGGKIHPRPHDNQLSYVGGETKILAVHRSIKFSGLISKLSAFCDYDVCFKYQLPGEDLDALISVTNDEDLEHMMHEYDRLYRGSLKPARLRLFLFPANPSLSSFGSDEVRSDRELFMDALNSPTIQSSAPPTAVAPPGHVDLLFGTAKGIPPAAAAAAKIPDQIAERMVPEREIPLPVLEDRVLGSDHIQRHVQDLQRLQIGGQEQAIYRRKSDDNLVRDNYFQNVPENLPPTTSPVTVTVPGVYWQGKQMVNGVSPVTSLGTEQPVYMIPPQASMYHAPMVRPVAAQAGQGYYAPQRMTPEVYREQPVYSMVPPMAAAAAAAPPPNLPPQAPAKVAAYPEGIGMVRPPTMQGGVVTETGYTQVAYDSAAGRHVFYTTPGGVMPPPPQYQAISADMRPSGALNQEGRVVAKVSQ